jgi:hypothetical protein
MAMMHAMSAKNAILQWVVLTIEAQRCLLAGELLAAGLLLGFDSKDAVLS